MAMGDRAAIDTSIDMSYPQKVLRHFFFIHDVGSRKQEAHTYRRHRNKVK